MRWVEPPELEELLRSAGFGRSRISGGFAGEPVSEDTASLIVEAWRD
jgi:hypothetical protein